MAQVKTIEQHLDDAKALVAICRQLKKDWSDLGDEPLVGGDAVEWLADLVRQIKPHLTYYSYTEEN